MEILKKFGQILGFVLLFMAHGHAAPPVVLVYHDVQDETKAPFADPFTVTIQEFTSQLQWLKSQGYVFISLTQFKQWSDNKLELPPNSVLLTVDDALKSTCTTILPLVTTLDIPVVVSVVTSWIGTSSPVNAGLTKMYGKDFCSWEELRAATQYGDAVALASHTHASHLDVDADALGRRQPAVITRKWDSAQGRKESDAEYFKRLELDFSASREAILSATGKEPDTMVWPYGRSNMLAIKAARNAGFSYFFGLNDTPSNLTDKTFKRVLVTGGLSPYMFQASVSLVPRPSKSILVEIYPDYVNSAARLDALFDRLSALDLTGVIVPAAETNKYTGRVAWGVRSRLGLATIVQADESVPAATLKEIFSDFPVDGLINLSCDARTSSLFKRYVVSDAIFCPLSGHGKGQRSVTPVPGKYLDLSRYKDCSQLDYVASALREARLKGVTDYVLPSSVATCAVLPDSLKKELFVKPLSYK